MPLTSICLLLPLWLNLMLQDDGSYAGFDPEEFTSRAIRHM